MTRRSEFSKSTRAEAYSRCGGVCECGCGKRILGTPEYHHAVESALGGSNDLDNCLVLDPKCHRTITSEVSMKRTSKSNRVREKHAGIRRSSRGFRKADGMKFDWTTGKYVRAE